ncbi:MAG: hypothetical protein IPO08_20075 [Xanthomonadales bacterium]|nr:hypothetical protein [Xanthomonadales bacterium]
MDADSEEHAEESASALSCDETEGHRETVEAEAVITPEADLTPAPVQRSWILDALEAASDDRSRLLEDPDVHLSDWIREEMLKNQFILNALIMQMKGET